MRKQHHYQRPLPPEPVKLKWPSRPKVIPAETRYKVFRLMRIQRAAQRRIDELLDAVPKLAHTERNHSEQMRKIWRARGK